MAMQSIAMCPAVPGGAWLASCQWVADSPPLNTFCAGIDADMAPTWRTTASTIPNAKRFSGSPLEAIGQERTVFDTQFDTPSRR